MQSPQSPDGPYFFIGLRRAENGFPRISCHLSVYIWRQVHAEYGRPALQKPLLPVFSSKSPLAAARLH